MFFIVIFILHNLTYHVEEFVLLVLMNQINSDSGNEVKQSYNKI